MAICLILVAECLTSEVEVFLGSLEVASQTLGVEDQVAKDQMVKGLVVEDQVAKDREAECLTSEVEAVSLGSLEVVSQTLGVECLTSMKWVILEDLAALAASGVETEATVSR